MPIKIGSRNWLVGVRQPAYAMPLTHNPLLDRWLAVFPGNQCQTNPSFELSADEGLLKNGNDAGLFCAVGESPIVAGAGYHDRRCGHAPRTKKFNQLDSGHFRHVLIDEDASKLINLGTVQKVGGRFETPGGDPTCAQEKPQRVADRRIVFDNSHGVRHHGPEPSHRGQFPRYRAN